MRSAGPRPTLLERQEREPRSSAVRHGSSRSGAASVQHAGASRAAAALLMDCCFERGSPGHRQHRDHREHRRPSRPAGANTRTAHDEHVVLVARRRTGAAAGTERQARARQTIAVDVVLLALRPGVVQRSTPAARPRDSGRACGGDHLQVQRGLPASAVAKSTTGTADEQIQALSQVDDLAAELAELRSRGVEIQEYDTPGLKIESTASRTWASRWWPGSSIPHRNASKIMRLKLTDDLARRA